MKNVVRSLLPLLTFVLVACQGAGSDDPGTKNPQPPEGVITGTLTNRDGSPAAGAHITLGDGHLSSASLTTTAARLGFANERGEFAFDVDDAGEYTLTTLTDNEGAFARVTVTRNPTGQLVSTPVAMQANELGGIEGKVETSGPAAWAYLLGTSFLANTDPEGAFAISRVPAGDYLLAPGLLGVTGTPVPVTVQAGQVTKVTDPLRFGPTITSVEPSGFIAAPWNPITGSQEPNRITIKGSGFGQSIGVSQLRYAHLEISDHVHSWTDNEIVIDTYFGNSNWTIPLEDLRFTFANVTGEAHSDQVGIVNGYLQESSCDYDHGAGWISVTPYVFGTNVQGAEITFAVVNGVARRAPGGQVVSTVTTDENGCAQAFIEPGTGAHLPVIVTASFNGIELAHYVPTAVHLELGDNQVYPGPNTLQGRLLRSDLLEPLADDGNYTAIVHCSYRPEARSPLSLDSSGAFFILVVVPEGGECYQVVVEYRDVALTYADLYTNPAGPNPTDLKPPVTTVMAIDDTLQFNYMAESIDDIEWDIEIDYATTDVQAVFDHYDSMLRDLGFNQVDIDLDTNEQIEAEYRNTTTGVWVELGLERQGFSVNVDLNIEDPRSYTDGSVIPPFSLTEFLGWDITVYASAEIRDVDWDFNFDHPNTSPQEVFDYYDQYLRSLGWVHTSIDNDESDEWEINYRLNGVHLELEVEDEGGGTEVELELNKLRFYQH